MSFACPQFKCQTALFNSKIGPYQVLLLFADLGAMVIKGHSAFPKAPELMDPHHQIVYCHMQGTCWNNLTSLQKCSMYILQPQPIVSVRETDRETATDGGLLYGLLCSS